MARAGATRSEVVRAALRQLRIAIADDPAKLLAAVQAGDYPSPEQSLSKNLGTQN
jgi:hypothetical protein